MLIVYPTQLVASAADDGSVKRSAEITGGYNTALVSENLMYLEK